MSCLENRKKRSPATFSPRPDDDVEELVPAQGDGSVADGSCESSEDMLTASSPSASEKSDVGLCSDSDDDDARFGQAGRVISVIQDCRAVNVNANSDIVFRHKTRKTVHFGHMSVDDCLRVEGH
jgi:hypothetical protein